MSDFKIGVVTIGFNEEGKATEASFKPESEVVFDHNLLAQLRDVPCSKDADNIKANAELVLAAWITKVDEITLADREEYQIVSNSVECVTFPGGKIKKCSIQFTLKQIADETT